MLVLLNLFFSDNNLYWGKCMGLSLFHIINVLAFWELLNTSSIEVINAKQSL